ncbi:Zn-ribbon-containing protein [Alginatibacterium sediminis]|nr:Zn-ribbon-containing protein [Alginatibacterium sediminis]
MYSIELNFECYQDTTVSKADKAISDYIEALRDCGLVIGREFPSHMVESAFITRAMSPRADSVTRKNYSKLCLKAVDDLHAAGVLEPKVAVKGIDLHADHSDPCYEEGQPSWQIVYTNYLSSCTPLRCGDHFMPIPLQFFEQTLGARDFKPLLQWQQNWMALDELQMLGTALVEPARRQISEFDSELSKQGRSLAQQIENLSGVPTYYYIYRGGGQSLATEQERLCPSCGGQWRLAHELHDVIDFKCDNCKLVSSYSWDFK